MQYYNAAKRINPLSSLHLLMLLPLRAALGMFPLLLVYVVAIEYGRGLSLDADCRRQPRPQVWRCSCK